MQFSLSDKNKGDSFISAHIDFGFGTLKIIALSCIDSEVRCTISSRESNAFQNDKWTIFKGKTIYICQF